MSATRRPKTWRPDEEPDDLSRWLIEYRSVPRPPMPPRRDPQDRKPRGVMVCGVWCGSRR